MSPAVEPPSAERLARNLLLLVRAFLQSEDCRLMTYQDRLALEINHPEARLVLETMLDGSDAAPRDPDGRVVSSFYEAQDWIGWLGIREVIGVRPRGTPTWSTS